MTNDEPRSFKRIDLDDACEEIFQHHKRHIIVNRTPDTFPSMDFAVEEQAMNLLEHQKVIFKPNPSDFSVRQINPIVTGASSYHQALTIVQEKGERAPMKIAPAVSDSAPIDILEPPKRKKLKAFWIVIVIIVLLFVLFNFVPFYKRI